MLSKKLFLSSIVLFVLLSYPLVVLVEAEPSWVIWSQTYGGTKEDCANSLIETSDGGYSLAGNTRSFGAGDEDFWLIKTDEFGNMEWNKTYGGADYDSAYSLVATADGGYALAGGNLLVKTDELGYMEWNQTYEPVSSCSSLIVTSDGGYAIAGATGSAGDRDFWLVKTDEYGVVPEYFSWLLPSLLLTATLVIVIYKKKFFDYHP